MSIEETDSLFAPKGMFRIISYDQFDHTYFTCGDFEVFEDAKTIVRKMASAPNAGPTSFSDIYCIYDDGGRKLIEITYDSLQKEIVSEKK